MTNIPFYPNHSDNEHCWQAVFMMVLKHFTGRKYNIPELDEITGKLDGMWTWPTLSLGWLMDQSFKVRIISQFDYRAFAERGVDYLLDVSGKQLADRQSANCNIPREQELAKNFIDWFLSKDLQDNIAENNWMYPANEYAQISSTFNESAINPDDVNILNSLLSSETIGTNLELWKEDWETLISSGLKIDGYISIFIIFASIGSITYIQKKIRKIEN